jgi:hypothetical protein
LQTNSELRSAASSGGSITPCPLLETLCSMIYRMSERIASLPSLCLALSPSHEYEGIAEEELLLASLRMVVACSNTSDHTCSEILHCPLPSSLSTAEWLSAFVMQALRWEGELFQLRLELREKPVVDDTCLKSTVDESGTDLSQYVSLAGPLSPTETSVEVLLGIFSCFSPYALLPHDFIPFHLMYSAKYFSCSGSSSTCL